MSVLKIRDGNNWVEIPASGVGVPQGGNAGEVLTKASSTDYDAGWVLPLSMKLLWTNPSPSSDFAAQTVSLDLSGYTAGAIVFAASKSDYTLSSPQFFLMNNATQRMICTVWAIFQYRDITVSTSGITFSEGRRINTYNSGSSVQNNGEIIPVYIYGLKGIT